MKVYEAVLKRRSIRKFKQKKIPFKILEKLVDAAHLAPSAGNLQPAEFIIVDKKEKLDEVFSCTRWAIYLEGKGTPGENFRPTAYIVALLNKNKPTHPLSIADIAAGIENILLVALEEGLSSCWIGSLDRDKLRQVLQIPENCVIDSVVALGYPAEKSRIEPFKNDVKYWKDKNGNLHIPKRSLKEIVHLNTY